VRVEIYRSNIPFWLDYATLWHEIRDHLERKELKKQSSKCSNPLSCPLTKSTHTTPTCSPPPSPEKRGKKRGKRGIFDLRPSTPFLLLFIPGRNAVVIHCEKMKGCSLGSFFLLLLLLLVISSPGANAFGSNYIQYSSTAAVGTTSSHTVSSSITVSGFPVTSFNSNGNNVGITVTLALAHNHPEDLIIWLADPDGYGPTFSYKSKGSTVPCTSYYNPVTFADSQTYQNPSSGSSSIPCPPTTLTPVGSLAYSSGYYDEYDALEEIHSTSTPFAATIEGDKINGKWTLHIDDVNSGVTGTLSSWYIRLYCERPLFSISFSARHWKFLSFFFSFLFFSFFSQMAALEIRARLPTPAARMVPRIPVSARQERLGLTVPQASLAPTTTRCPTQLDTPTPQRTPG